MITRLQQYLHFDKYDIALPWKGNLFVADIIKFFALAPAGQPVTLFCAMP
ncbi:MAG: hypothetical protein ABIN01_24470 [Ferruginibacter sp.]